MTLKLDSMARRIIAIFLTALICIALFRVSIAHFVIRVVADQRFVLEREAIAAAAEKQPESARINFRLAASELMEPAEPAKSLYHATRAVALSPWDYQARQLLALAQELNGRQVEAENSILAAVKLAPNHAELNWTLANILIRNGKLRESVEHFRIASLTRGDLLQDSFDLLWQASGEELDMLRSLAKDDSEVQLALVKYMIGKSRVPDAIAIFVAIDRGARLDSPRSAEFISTLINAGQTQSARALWMDLAGALSKVDPATVGNIWNGSFESDWLRNFDQFDWYINPNKYARIGLDRSETHTGLRSLRMVFSGRDTTTIKDQVRQLIILRPGARYRLDCYVKAVDLMTPEGPRIAIVGGNGVIAASDPVPIGTSEWRQLVVDFTAPQDNSPKFVSIVRIPKYSYDEPTKGTLWFDDFTLSEIGNGR